MTESTELPEVVDLLSLTPLGDELGGGSHAVVYALPSMPGHVLKRYRATITPDDDALDAIVAWRHSLTAEERAIVDDRAAVPIARVVHDGATTGVVMIDSRSVLGTRVLAAPPGELEPEHAVSLLASLAELLVVFDRHGCVHGELSPAALLYDAASTRVVLIDCDTLAIGQRSPPLARHPASGWSDRRVSGGTLPRAGVESDREMFARLFTFLYPKVAYRTAAITACLERSMGPDAPRASVAEWFTALAELRELLDAPPATPVDLSDLPPPSVGLGDLPPPSEDESRPQVRMASVVVGSVAALLAGFAIAFVVVSTLF